jgi:sortase A
MNGRVLVQRIEYGLWIVGALALGFCAGILIETHVFQTLQNRALERELRGARPGPPARLPTFPLAPRPEGSLVGRLEIPRLGLSAVVLEGSDSKTLRVAIGRVMQTAEPGEQGNVVLGGHRDTFFRPLRQIRDGDEITLVTPGGRYQYVVDWTKVVKPTDTSSLAPTQQPALTLVTCYPFHFIGHAPERFIVRARQVRVGQPGPVIATTRG